MISMQVITRQSLARFVFLLIIIALT